MAEDRTNIKFKKARTDRGMTMMALAESADCSITSVLYIEKYGHVPGEELQLRISKALGLTPGDLWN